MGVKNLRTKPSPRATLRPSNFGRHTRRRYSLPIHLVSTADSNAKPRPTSHRHAVARGNEESPFLPNHGFITTVAVKCLRCPESVSARKRIGKSHLLSACHAVGALVSFRGHKNASSGLVGGFREAGVGIAQASHGGRSIGGQGRCDFVTESCPLTIPLLLINRRHLNAPDACAPAKSSSALRQPQHLARTKNADSYRVLPFCITRNRTGLASG